MALRDRLPFRRAGSRPAAPRGESSQQGRSGTVNIDGYLRETETNAALTWPQNLDTYEEMRRTEPTVRNSLALAQTPIRAAKRIIEPASEERQDLEVAAFVERVLVPRSGGRGELAGGFSEWLRQALDFMVYGHELFERVAAFRPVRFDFKPSPDAADTVTVEREAFVIAKLAVRLPGTLTRWITDDADPAVLKEVVQAVYDGREPPEVRLDAKRLVVLTHERQGDDWRGISLLRSAYKPYRYKNNLELIEAIAAERSTGLPVAYPPEGADDADLDAMVELLKSIRQGEESWALMPGPKQGAGVGPESGWLLEVVGVNAAGGEGGGLLDRAISRHDAAMMKNVLAEFMRLGHENVGARATADVQQDPYYLAVEAYADYVQGVINEQIVQPLVDWNYEVDDYPQFRFSDIRARNVEAIAGYVNQLLAQKAITADPELERWLRSMIEAPELADAPSAEERKVTPPTEPPAGGNDDDEQATPPPDEEGGDGEFAHRFQVTDDLEGELAAAVQDILTPAVAGISALRAEEAFAARGYYGDDPSERERTGRFRGGGGAPGPPNRDINAALKANTDVVRIDNETDDLPRKKPNQPTSDFDEVFDRAEADKQAYRELLDLGQGLSKRLGADTLVDDDLASFERKAAKAKAKPGKPVVVIAPLKRRETARSKLERKDYGPEGLSDLNRSSVLVDRLDKVPAAIKALREEAKARGWTLHEPDNGFAGEGADGYRHFAVVARSPAGHVTEIQFHINAMWEAKFRGAGHKLYEQVRAIDETPKPWSKELKQRRAQLRKQTRELYDTAYNSR